MREKRRINQKKEWFISRIIYGIIRKIAVNWFDYPEHLYIQPLVRNWIKSFFVFATEIILNALLLSPPIALVYKLSGVRSSTYLGFIIDALSFSLIWYILKSGYQDYIEIKEYWKPEVETWMKKDLK